jgi:hypothetical protein
LTTPVPDRVPWSYLLRPAGSGELPTGVVRFFRVNGVIPGDREGEGCVYVRDSVEDQSWDPLEGMPDPPASAFGIELKAETRVAPNMVKISYGKALVAADRADVFLLVPEDLGAGFLAVADVAPPAPRRRVQGEEPAWDLVPVVARMVLPDG